MAEKRTVFLRNVKNKRNLLDAEGGHSGASAILRPIRRARLHFLLEKWPQDKFLSLEFLISEHRWRADDVREKKPNISMSLKGEQDHFGAMWALGDRQIVKRKELTDLDVVRVRDSFS